MPRNRAVGAGIGFGIALAGLVALFGYDFGTWLVIGLLLGVAGGVAWSRWS